MDIPIPFVNTKKIEEDIDSIQGDFSFIKYELEGIAQGLKDNFEGIGTSNCADYLYQVKSNIEAKEKLFNALNEPYKNVLHGLNELNPNK